MEIHSRSTWSCAAARNLVSASMFCRLKSQHVPTCPNIPPKATETESGMFGMFGEDQNIREVIWDLQDNSIHNDKWVFICFHSLAVAALSFQSWPNPCRRVCAKHRGGWNLRILKDLMGIDGIATRHSMARRTPSSKGNSDCKPIVEWRNAAGCCMLLCLILDNGHSFPHG